MNAVIFREILENPVSYRIRRYLEHQSLYGKKKPLRTLKYFIFQSTPFLALLTNVSQNSYLFDYYSLFASIVALNSHIMH